MKRSQFSALAAAAALAPRTARAQAPATVRIGYSPTESYALAYYAQQEGFFARHGIDAQLTVVPGASGGTSAALAAGAIDVGCLSMGPISNAHLRGIPMKLLAPGALVVASEQTTDMVVNDGSSIRKAADLNGKILGTVVLKDLQHVAMLKYIDANGGDSKTVRVVELPVPDAVAAIASGRIDAYPLSEPFLSASLGNGMRTIDPVGIYTVISKRMMVSMHAAMDDWINKNPVAARGVVTAMREAARWANTNPAGVATKLEVIAKLPAATFSRMKHVVFAETFESNSVQPEIDALAEYGFIPRGFSVNDVLWSPSHASGR